MVDIADINDSDRLLRWLKEQPNDVSVWVTCRAAMRLLPDWWHFALTSDDKSRHGLTALPVLRCNLIAAVARSMPIDDIKYVATEAADAANVIANAAGTAAYAAYAAANSANASADNPFITVPAAAYAVNAVAYAAAYDANIWPLIRADCRAFLAGDDLDRLSLWGDQANPYADSWADIKQQLRSDTSTDWSFWTKWYDDALAGTPPNWKMFERIALIDPKDWDKGAEVVNPLIAEIQLRYELKDQISTLESKLQSASTAMRGMGDNQGPAMDAAVAKELLIVWAPLQELKQEVESEAPDKPKVLEIAERLSALSITMAKWVAGKVDTVVNAFAVAAGTGAAGLAFAWYTQEANTVVGLLSKISELTGKWVGYLQ